MTGCKGEMSMSRFYLKGSRLSLVLLLFISFTVNLHADDGGNTRIRLSGNVAEGIDHRITVKQIEAIGVSTIDAYNPYEKRSDKYTGVWLNKFVQSFAQPGVSMITMKAIDDYKSDFYSSEWDKLKILIATQVNEEYISPEMKGPMRIVIADFDPDQKIYQDTLPKWMWMINRIEFK